MSEIDDRASARAARLRYSTDARPGISRRRAGRGFAYRRSDGAPVSDADTKARIRGLAIPPAWADVWICPDPAGHIEATGRDPHHPNWQERFAGEPGAPAAD